MIRPCMFHRASTRVLWFLLLAVLVPVLGRDAAAQGPVLLTGVVVDGAGSVISGARITVTDSAGAVAQTMASDNAGAFTVRGLEPGTYAVLVEMNLFSPQTAAVTVSAAGSAAPLRVVLTAGGFAETVVVTARRTETRLAEIPQQVDVIDSTDIERSVASDLTDVLKKNASVDVIQYSGLLSGIGIRGFRPQFSGINKRSLLLVDGRPSGVTNLSTLLLDNVDRVEVLKGPASAVYGSSAMGGVVNIITRQSRGAIGGTARLGAASFGGSEFAGRAGGSLSPRVDVDVTGGAVNQRDDFRMGNGVVRPSTSYTTYDGSLRVGVDVGDRWRVDGRANAYRGRDIMTPGDLASGINLQGSKDLDHSSQDVRIGGRLSAHALSFTGYHASEAGRTTNVSSTDPADLPYLPYLSFGNELGWTGIQAQDAWNWSRSNSLLAGVDFEKVTSLSRSYARTGTPIAPFSADSNKRTAGVYAENTLKLGGGRTVLAVGGRVDRITNETVATPLKTNFTPSESAFTVFSPSAGITYELVRGLRAHVTAGRAFIPAEAIMLTGFTTTTVGGRTQISQGNASLKPERSTSFDAGVEWTASTTRFDVTAFRTVVTDRFISNVVIANPAPPEPIVLSVVNGLDAHISGVDAELEQRLGARLGTFLSLTHYVNSKERLANGAEQDILNVARNTVRAGVDVDWGRVSARVSGRYVEGRKDNNFNLPGFPIVDYDNFGVVDLSVTYRLVRQHAVSLAVNNLFDTYYYEKLGFPLQGASFKLAYRVGF
ncbi:MAG: TonB-dependent receptor [Acidobacteria bacterium]|nr:TonB-dependent receptor [Acidobacteriota bacterium]